MMKKSKVRLMIEKIMSDSKTPKTRTEIIAEVREINIKISDHQIEYAIANCIGDGTIKNVSKNKRCANYVWHTNANADAPEITSTPYRPVPPKSGDEWTPPDWSKDTHVFRRGSQDFLNCPTREGNLLKPHKKPISMAGQSKVPPYYMNNR